MTPEHVSQTHCVPYTGCSKHTHQYFQACKVLYLQFHVVSKSDLKGHGAFTKAITVLLMRRFVFYQLLEVEIHNTHVTRIAFTNYGT